MKFLISFSFVFMSQAVFAANDTNAKQQLIYAGSNPSLWQTMFSLIAVITLILLLAWLAKRFNSMALRQDKALSIVAGISISNKDKIILLQAGDKQLLVGVSPGNINTLHVFENSIVKHPSSDSTTTFNDYLSYFKRNAKS